MQVIRKVGESIAPIAYRAQGNAVCVPVSSSNGHACRRLSVCLGAGPPALRVSGLCTAIGR